MNSGYISTRNINKKFDVFYNEKIDDFCRNAIDQFNKVENRFSIDERELITTKLNQIRPEIKRLERDFYEKTKDGLNKLTKYPPDEIALFGYWKFYDILHRRVKEIDSPISKTKKLLLAPRNLYKMSTPISAVR